MRKDYMRKEKKNHIIESPEKEKKKKIEEIKNIIYLPIIHNKIIFKMTDITIGIKILILCLL